MLVYAKAITAGLVAGLGALSTALADGSVTLTEGTAVALATVVAVGAVFGVANKASK